MCELAEELDFGWHAFNAALPRKACWYWPIIRWWRRCLPPANCCEPSGFETHMRAISAQERARKRDSVNRLPHASPRAASNDESAERSDAPGRSGPAKREDAHPRSGNGRRQGSNCRHGMGSGQRLGGFGRRAVRPRGLRGARLTLAHIGNSNWGRLSRLTTATPAIGPRLAPAAAFGRATATARGPADRCRPAAHIRRTAAPQDRHGLCRNQQGGHPDQRAHGKRAGGNHKTKDSCEKRLIRTVYQSTHT